jgi:hypothetical protein
LHQAGHLGLLLRGAFLRRAAGARCQRKAEQFTGNGSGSGRGWHAV